MAKKKKKKQEQLFPMRVASRLTGLTADVIRVWERRYKAIDPKRTKGKSRMFSESDISRLELLANLTRQGHRIKSIASKENTDLEQMLLSNNSSDKQAQSDRSLQNRTPQHHIISKYLRLIFMHKSEESEKLLNDASLILDARTLVLDVILPILTSIGNKWETGEFTITQEHMASEQIKRLLLTIFHSLKTSSTSKQKILFATPESQLHEFGALTGAIIARLNGCESVYLGPNLPISEITAFAEKEDISIAVLSLARNQTTAERVKTAEAINQLSKISKVWIGCSREHKIPVKPGDDVQFFHDFISFEETLNQQNNIARTA